MANASPFGFGLHIPGLLDAPRATPAAPAAPTAVPDTSALTGPAPAAVAQPQSWGEALFGADAINKVRALKQQGDTPGALGTLMNAGLQRFSPPDPVNLAFAGAKAVAQPAARFVDTSLGIGGAATPAAAATKAVADVVAPKAAAATSPVPQGNDAREAFAQAFSKIPVIALPAAMSALGKATEDRTGVDAGRMAAKLTLDSVSQGMANAKASKDPALQQKALQDAIKAFVNIKNLNNMYIPQASQIQAQD